MSRPRPCASSAASAPSSRQAIKLPVKVIFPVLFIAILGPALINTIATLQGKLAAEIGEPPAARFARGVVRLWPQRRARLAETLAVGATPAAVDAALSLRTAASMTGAARLADAAHHIVGCVRAQGISAAMALLPQALACRDVTLAVLARGLPADLAGAASAAVFSRPPAAAGSPRP